MKRMPLINIQISNQCISCGACVQVSPWEFCYMKTFAIKKTNDYRCISMYLLWAM
jgi:ferredoxin